MEERKKSSRRLAAAWTNGLIVAIGYYIFFYVRENVSKARHLQLISGVNTFIFWLVPLILDLLMYHVTVCTLVVLTVICQVEEFNDSYQLCWLTFVLSTFGFFMIPFMYLSSYLFAQPSYGYSFVFGVVFFLGPMLPAMVQVVKAIMGKHSNPTESMLLYLYFPFYAFTNGVFRILSTFSNRQWCVEQEYETVLKEACELQDLCCAIRDCQEVNNECYMVIEACKVYKKCQELFDSDYMQMDKDHLGVGIACSYGLALFCFLLLLLKDSGQFHFLRMIMKKKPNKVSPIEPDVKQENDVIMNTPVKDLKQHYVLVFRDLTKYYKKLLAVNGVCIGIKPDECFGLIGSNGAGKTTIFKMITNDVSISHGEIYIAGSNVERKRRKAVKLIGYCPQFDALLEELTPRETLRIFCLLRGVPWSQIKALSENLAKEFDFFQYLGRRIKELSGGNKRKLSISLAMVGDSRIVCLDEPTSGIDPSSKRLVWNALTRVRQSGKPIILSSHDMEECEALCTRACVMVKGNMKCIGSVQRLKSKFAQGFNLTIKMKKGGSKDAMDKFVKSNFPKAVLKETYQHMVTYQIPDGAIPYSRIFGTIEGNRDRMGIEDYSLGQGTLEQVFLNFMEQEHDV